MVEQLDLFQTSERESNLSPRCWELYRLIKHNSLVEHRKTTQREIYEKVSGYEWNDDEKAHDHCVQIWNDIKDNNLSMEHQHLIISKNYEYWLGSEEETNQYLKDLWKALEPRLTRYWKYYNKIKLHNQGRLLDKNGNVIDNEATRFFECFNAYNVSMGE